MKYVKICINTFTEGICIFPFQFRILKIFLEARLLIFRIFSDPPPCLLIFRFEEASLTLPQRYVENKKC